MIRYKKLTSQIQELQERVNSMNDSGEFQEIESIRRGKSSRVPVPSPRALSSSDQSLRSDTWNLSGSQGKFLAIHKQ